MPTHHDLNALEHLTEAISLLRTWISDHRPSGQDTSGLVEVDCALEKANEAISAAVAERAAEQDW